MIYTRRKESKLIYGFLLISILFTASCASTKITDTWKDKTYKGRAQNIVVIMIARNTSLRNMFEGRFAAALRARGNNAFQSNTIIPIEELANKELVIAKIKNTTADTVLVARLVDSKTIESYVPGGIHGLPVHYSYWGSYYEVAYIDYGYTGNMEVSYVETNLYDVKTEKLIWTARSKTERSEGEQQLINTFIKKIVTKLSSDKLIR